MPQLKLSYKIFMEAEDISQSRIISSTSFVKNRLENHRNPYISRAVPDDESDPEEFALRLYVEESIEEEQAGQKAAESFIGDLADLAGEIAHMHSFLEMEGAFSITFDGESLSYAFASERGSSACDFRRTDLAE